MDCYTGFKWIAREVRLAEGKKIYIGGGEESYGFMAEDFVRDKDAVSACCLIGEVAAWAKDQGKSLYELLLDIYVEYGFTKNAAVSVVKPGKSGAEEIKAMMDDFRKNPPHTLGGHKVVLWKDYKTLKQVDSAGRSTKLQMPESSNVLQYFTVDGAKLSRNESVSLDILVRICRSLDCRIQDVIEVLPRRKMDMLVAEDKGEHY
jgi:phosphoglucomutase